MSIDKQQMNTKINVLIILNNIVFVWVVQGLRAEFPDAQGRCVVFRPALD